MNRFILKLSPGGGSPDHGALSCYKDASAIKISSTAFELEAAHTPEVSLCYSERDKGGDSQYVIVVFGHLVYRSQICSENKIAQSFLEAWKKNPTSLLDKIDGSFLLVLHEVRSGQTILVSDPCGTRPAWICRRDDVSWIGSSPLDVARNAGHTIEPDPAWMWSMLHNRRTVGTRSSVKGVRGIPPGSVVRFEKGTVSTETWFDYTYTPDTGMSARAFGLAFLERVQESVLRTCRTSKSPLLLLSGGVDSRLLAAVCPKNVQCVTLCDSINREVKLAGQVAKAAGLKHEVLIRPESWYPDLLRDSCEISGGMWLWDQAHFLPLGERKAAYDSTLTGYGSDSLFKGKDLGRDGLWDANCSADQLHTRALSLLEESAPRVKGGRDILAPAYVHHCRTEFLDECAGELEQLVPCCSTLPELWQLFWNRNMACASALLNLLCLRGFTAERSAFTTVSMRRFHQILPLDLVRSGQLPILALRQGGFRKLLTIPDANTWLPHTFPAPLHRFSMTSRKHIAHVRKQLRARKISADYRSNCSWPHNGRFWLKSDKMFRLLDGFIKSGGFDPEMFEAEQIAQDWTDHLGGHSDYSALLDFLVTYGCVFIGDHGE